MQGLAEGVRNLLSRCAEIQPGQRLLVLREDPALGWYDRAAPEAVAAEARAMGATATVQVVGAPTNAEPAEIAASIAAHDAVIFFARIGDQDRFEDRYPGKTVAMSYARRAGDLASVFGRTDHRAMAALKSAVNAVLRGAGRIEVTCPLGTRVSGSGGLPEAGEVAVRRFPLGVPQPVPAEGFSGQVALARYLTPTGSRVYDPAWVPIAEPVMAQIEGGRIAGLDGPAAETARIHAHYQRVAATFGIEALAVHSWHAGFHPGCTDARPAAEDPDRWANTVFNSPRVLHFHTCGAYAPGEICWMVLDATVMVDRTPLWRDGVLCPENFAPLRDCLRRWPELPALFSTQLAPVGI